MCRQKSERLGTRCRRCEPRSHHSLPLLGHGIRRPQTTSHAHQAASVPAPPFLPPSSRSHQAQLCNFQLPHIMPQHPLEESPAQFCLIIADSFFFSPSPPVILRSSLVLEDVMSSEVFMFVEIYKQMS